MSEYEFKRPEQKVAYIMDNIPHARYNYLPLILSYWSIFDGIDIPPEVFQQIVEKGTQPETITRSRRKVFEQYRMKQYLELQRMAKEQVEVKAPLKQGGNFFDRQETEKS